MAKMSFNEDWLLEEPCASCDKCHIDIDNLFHEWHLYCDEKECPYKENEKEE